MAQSLRTKISGSFPPMRWICLRNMSLNIYIYIYIYMYIYIHIYILYIYIYIRLCMCVCVYIYIYIYVLHLSLSIYIYIHITLYLILCIDIHYMSSLGDSPQDLHDDCADKGQSSGSQISLDLCIYIYIYK